MAKLTITAEFLEEGDIVTVAKGVEWKVTSTDGSAKSMSVSAVYTQCDFSPSRVGTSWSHRYRNSTKLQIERN